MLCAFERSYRVGAQQVSYLETFDWYCLPELRRSGLGILLLRTMMDRPEPIISVGGSPDTLAMLPRMRWRTLAVATNYTLPLVGSTVSAKLKQRYGLPDRLTSAASNVSARFWFRPKGRPAPPTGRVIPAAAIGGEVKSLYEGTVGYGLAQVADPAFNQWLTQGYAGSGHFISLYFEVAGALRGWTLARVFPTPDGWEGSIVDLYAPNPDVMTYAWMVSEIVMRLAHYQPRKISASVTCPILQAALRQNRFVRGATFPVYLWWREPELPKAPIHLARNTGDWPFLPYPLPEASDPASHRAHVAEGSG
jgi:hypothetical protein